MGGGPINKFHIDLAVRTLDEGGIVLHATEGVWGLACDPFDRMAVAKLLELKGRSVEKGLILIGDTAACFEPELESLDPGARRQIEDSWPGAVTWIVPNRQFPFWITGGRETVAVRVPGHEQARALSRVFGGPLVSTSANRAGQTPALNALQARCRFGKTSPANLIRLLPGEVVCPGRPSRILTSAGVAVRT
jgi:L-threonylcarbamoyladenylate synthase